MGNSSSNVTLPDSTPSLVKAVTIFHLTKSDCQRFCLIWNKIDPGHVGKASLEMIFGYFGYQRTPFTDGLLDLIEVNHNGHIDFGQFVLLISTYCMLEEKDILRCRYYYNIFYLLCITVHLFLLLLFILY
jgi:Ca2+-binding EF-hand superfamily protein